MTKRIFRSICAVALVVFLASVTLIMGMLYDYFSRMQKAQLKMQTILAAQGVENEGQDYFTDLDIQNYRITWISSDGTVLYDSKTDSSTMENHLEREEIQQALKEGYGESARYSVTLMERALYSAKELEDGTVLRVSIAQNTVLTLLLGLLQPICIVFVIAVVMSLCLASRLSKRIVKPLNDLNLEEPLSNEDYDELSPLFRRIDSQHKKLKAQATELRHKQEEFDAVTRSMNEGLVLLNSKGNILSINSSAQKLLETDGSCVGNNILEVNRTLELHELIMQSLEGKKGEKVLGISEGMYQFDASPICSDGEIMGVVLLIFDVTEKERAEQMRREFTANVSHELKTPLHSISGYAELMCHGMVQQEDMGQFAEKIYTEAQRMIQLVEDIIYLSRLDEGAGNMQWSQVSLTALAQETIQSLQEEAKRMQVEVCLEGTENGDAYEVNGIPHLLRGIVYNLCDNAIKYNHRGGNVLVSLAAVEGNQILLQVKDTGIGIKPEEQNRVFERFYRVDKSHSKEVGGTGLGLSIVKHAAKIHDARIWMESTEGVGTCIRIYFHQ